MLSLAKFIRKEIELRENLVGTGFLDPPQPHDKPGQPGEKDWENADYRVTCMGEIVSASGFNADKLYVFYDTLVGDGWTFEDSNDYELYGMIRDENCENNKR